MHFGHVELHESGEPMVGASKLFDVFQALGFEMVLRDDGSGEVRW